MEVRLQKAQECGAIKQIISALVEPDSIGPIPYRNYPRFGARIRQ